MCREADIGKRELTFSNDFKKIIIQITHFLVVKRANRPR